MKSLLSYTALAFGMALMIPARAADSPSLPAQEAEAIAEEAYIYLYPLITMDVTRKQLTNLDAKTSAMGSVPITFKHVRAFPSADMRAVVRPNFDSFYSSPWLDLSKGSVVVSSAAK